MSDLCADLMLVAKLTIVFRNSINCIVFNTKLILCENYNSKISPFSGIETEYPAAVIAAARLSRLLLSP